MAVSCCQNPLTTNILCMSRPVFKYYSLIRLSRVKNMCRLHTCFYLSVISIQNVLDCKLSRKILNSCSIGIHTVLHCVSYKFVRRHSDKWRVWEVKMCVQSGWNLSVWYHTDDLDKWPLFGTYIVYIITNLLISKTKYRLNVTAWKVYQNNNPVVRFSIKALCIHTEIALNLLGLDKPVYINLIT